MRCRRRIGRANQERKIPLCMAISMLKASARVPRGNVISPANPQETPIIRELATERDSGDRSMAEAAVTGTVEESREYPNV